MQEAEAKTADKPDNNAAAPDPEFFAKMESLLNKLVPPASVKIMLASGTEIELSGAIPARRQVVVFRLMRDLTELPQVRKAMSGVKASDAGAVVDIVIALATDEPVAEALAEIFKHAYPDALPEGADPLDELPLEEIVAALVPFSERFIKRVGGGLTGLAASAVDLT